MMKSLLIGLLTFIFLSRPTLVNAKIELTTEEIPSEITITDPFTAKVTLSGVDPDTPYYIRGAFFAPDTTKYFGQTLNDQNIWINYPDDHQNFYKVQGDGVYLISFQIAPTDAVFSSNSQQLQFKIGRFTQAGSHNWGDSPPETISIINNTPSHTPTASPTIPMTTPTPTTSVYSPVAIGSVSLSEVYACQSANNDEWIELLNHTNQQMELIDWHIKDNTSTQSVLFSESIPPNGYLVVHLPNAILNNSGDSVRVLDSAGQLHDQMTYSQCSSATSWVNINQTWSQTLNITPESSNVLELLQHTLSPTLKLSPTVKISEKSTLDQKNESEIVDELSKSTFLNNSEVYAIPSTDSNTTNTSQQETTIPAAEAPPSTSTRQIPFTAGYMMLFGGLSHLISAAMLYEKIYGTGF